MKQKLEAIAYFKKNPAFKRIFEAMLKQWKIYGRCAGTIKLPNASDNEKETLGQFLGKYYSEQNISFKFIDFESALQATIFSGIHMLELLEAYFGHPIVTNKEVSRMKNEERSYFFHHLQTELEIRLQNSEQATAYILHILENKDYVYTLIMREYKKNQKDAIAMFINTWIGIEQLADNQRIRLAVLSSNVCGSPHYFDRDTAAGKCLLYALSYLSQTEYPKNAEEVVSLYYFFHILPDDISNFTIGYGLHLYCENGVHQAYEAFIEHREPYIVTLNNLSTIVRADAKKKVVYVVENQMLFSQLCEEVADYDVSIICTSGQMKLASLVLIDLVCQSNCNIYYAGDFDPEGLLIADRVITRNARLIHPWFYRLKDYEKAISNEIISEERRKQLSNIKNETLKIVAEAMGMKKRAGYQEILLDDMINEIKRNSKVKE